MLPSIGTNSLLLNGFAEALGIGEHDSLAVSGMQLWEVAVLGTLRWQGRLTYVHSNLLQKCIHVCVYDISTYTSCLLQYMCSNIFTYDRNRSPGYIMNDICKLFDEFFYANLPLSFSFFDVFSDKHKSLFSDRTLGLSKLYNFFEVNDSSEVILVMVMLSLTL